MAQTTPTAPALAWRGQIVTFGDLLRLVLKAEEALGELTDQRVCVPGEKSPQTVALLIACWQQHRPVLVPSAEYATAFVDELAARAGCELVATVWPRDTSFVRWRKPGYTQREASLPPLLPEDALLLLTTSGSTGPPKVVAISGEGVDAFIDWARQQFAIAAGTTALNYAPLNFDLSLLDVWTTLSSGGCVVLAPPAETVSSESLSKLITEHGVTLLQAVPLCFSTLADEAPAGPFPTVREIVVTGEALRPAVARALPALFPGARVANVYGCTETNDTFIHLVSTSELEQGRVLPIGQPMPGVEARLVDERNHIVAGAGHGQLLVSSPFQAHGYLDAALTQERFLSRSDARTGRADQGPKAQSSPVRPFFRSGDLVRRDEQGIYWLEGRDDHQVKVRGVRTSTTGVEEMLRGCPAVGEAAVIAVPDERDGHSLHVVVETISGPERAKLTTLALRRVCAQHLPAAVVPASFAIAEMPLPRTTTGKIDRQAIEEKYLQKGSL